ncbi:MAG: integrin alpha, partial [Pseudomonadota bacterium]
MNKPIFSFPLNPLAHAISVSRRRPTWKALLFGGLAGSLSLAEAFELSTLDGNNGFAIEGQNANEQLGKSVNGAGDINGDGIDDVILYARGADPAFGRAYIVFGRNTAASVNFTPRFDLTLLTANLTNLNTSFGFTIEGINGDNPARSVASAGDINGDGIDDLILGSAENTLGPNNLPLMGTGKAYVIYGRNTAQAGFFPNTIDLRQLTADQGFIISGITGGDQAGSAVDGVGDVNGDGIDDLVVGARFADAEGRLDAGESYVVFGKNASTDGAFPLNFELSSLDGSNGFTLSGANIEDLSGHAVSGAGDINGDG